MAVEVEIAETREGFKPPELNVAARFTSNLQTENGPTTREGTKGIVASVDTGLLHVDQGGHHVEQGIGSDSGLRLHRIRLVRICA